MPQVNTLSIDVAPSNDFSPVHSGASSPTKKSNKDFAQVIDQHYQSQESGKNQETSGNKTKLDNKVPLEKENLQDKPSTKDVQSQKKESGTASDTKVETELSETSEKNTGELSSKDNKSLHENAAQPENNSKESSEQQEPTLTNKSLTNLDSPEQLMSLLSASQKILSNDSKNESNTTLQKSENLAQAGSDNKSQGKSEIDALLKQVLGANNLPITKKTAENFPKDKAVDNLAEKVKPQAAINIETLAIKQSSESSIAAQASKNDVIDGKSNLDKVLVEGAPLEKLLGKKGELEPSTSAKKLDKDVEFIKNSATKGEFTGTSDESSDVIKSTDKNVAISNNNISKEMALKAALTTDHKNEVKQQMSASEIEAILSEMENTTSPEELEQLKAAIIANQDKALPTEQNSKNKSNLDASTSKQQINSALAQPTTAEKSVSETESNNNEAQLNTDKVAFAGVTIPGEKQAQENSQNHSRVINQSTQKVTEQQATSTGEQSQEQSLGQKSQNQTQGLTNDEKLVSNEAQVKEKPFSEIFDKKLVNTAIEKTINREIHQVNEATKSAASAEEMITKLASEQVQSTAQSVSNAKQVTSLQNEALSVYRKDFTGALKDKVMVMMNQKLQQVEIRLDPQELGNVSVKINLQNEQAVVNFTVQNQQAKEAFDQNLGRLKDMLAESGVDVGDANVEQQSKQKDDETLGDSRESGEGDASGNDLSELSDTQTLNLIKGSSTGVDYYA